MVTGKCKAEKMKVIDNEMRSFCKQEPETIEHLFVECLYTRDYLNEFLRWWHIRFNKERLQLSDEEILFGIQDKQHALLNHCIIIAKKTLYLCGSLEKLLFFLLFLIKLNQTYLTEKNIRYKDRSMHRFRKQMECARIGMI